MVSLLLLLSPLEEGLAVEGSPGLSAEALCLPPILNVFLGLGGVLSA
jgi:hypothetical protein